MRAPKNLVKVKYTMEEKYVDSNFIPYTGYYCELRGKAYPGKVYTGISKPLKLISSLVSNNKISNYVFIPDGKEYTFHLNKNVTHFDKAFYRIPRHSIECK